MNIRHQEFENGWNQTRQLWTLIANVNRDEAKKTSPFLPSDLVRLSFDGDEVNERIEPMSKARMEELKRRFGSKIVKRGK